jgi:hypothetical protein
MITPAPAPKLRKWMVGLTIGCWLAAYIVCPSHLLPQPLGQVLSLMASLLGLLSLFTAIGLLVEDSTVGVLLTARNTYSLSRLQMVLWTILVLGALMAATACRAWDHVAPLSIDIPTDLLTAMGISYVSAAAAPALLTLKSQGTPPPNQVAAAEGRMGEALAPTGQVMGRPAASSASLTDLIKGDELSTAGTIDLSKVQQLLITIMLIVVYGGSLGALFAQPDFAIAKTYLPPFTKDFVNLMLVSHGGYLVYKAASKPAADNNAYAQRPLPPDRNAGLSGSGETT